MPWVNEEMCTACGQCVEECPVDAITLQDNDKASIDMDQCIRCGTCHDTCPEEAVRHDGERIPLEVEANVAKTEQLLRHYDTPSSRVAFLERMARYFTKERKVAEQTIERIQALQAQVE